MLGAHLFGLPNVSPAGLELVLAVVWVAVAAPHLFSQCMRLGETSYRLGVQGVEVLILLGALFSPSVAAAFQQGFGVTELTLSGFAAYSQSWILQSITRFSMQQKNSSKMQSFSECNKVLLGKHYTFNR
jgi:hypothetical protein